MIELLSIDLSNYCSKQCPFCYNHSTRNGNTIWEPQEVIGFATDCIKSGGVKAVSLGGGEPFEYEGVFDIIDALHPRCYLSVTSNGLPLQNDETMNCLKAHKPDKIHITIHRPDNESEVDRVEHQMDHISALGIKPGLNLLVGADNVEYAKVVYSRFLKVLKPDQIILVPQRFSNTPTPKQLAAVTLGRPFQSPSCLLKCEPPKNFCSVSWDKKVNYCSYAEGKQQLQTLDYKGLMLALSMVRFVSCETQSV